MRTLNQYFHRYNIHVYISMSISANFRLSGACLKPRPVARSREFPSLLLRRCQCESSTAASLCSEGSAWSAAPRLLCGLGELTCFYRSFVSSPASCVLISFRVEVQSFPCGLVVMAACLLQSFLIVFVWRVLPLPA